MEALLSVRNLRINFRLDKDTTFEAVKGISFDIPKNATVALVGESGSGKSVTSLSMLGLLPKENASVLPGSEIRYDGRNLLELDAVELRKMRGADISMIFQEPMTSLNPVFTAGFQLGEVLRLHMGEIREQGPAKTVFENPQDAYTKALLQCRPRLDRRPVRLPVIEDFMGGSAHAMNLDERKRGVRPSDPIILDVRKLGKDFYTREGVFGRRKFEAVKDVSFKLPKGKTLGLVGESGSGKTTVGLTLMRLHEASAGEALFEGRDILSMTPRE